MSITIKKRNKTIKNWIILKKLFQIKVKVEIKDQAKLNIDIEITKIYQILKHLLKKNMIKNLNLLFNQNFLLIMIKKVSIQKRTNTKILTFMKQAPSLIY